MADKRQIFVFRLSGEEYAIDVENVKEIIRAEEKEVISVPNVPDFIQGIANVRGQAVPLIDLERRFDLETQENDYIVIINLENTTAGLLVDDVEEVKKVDLERIKEAPEIIEQEIHREYVDSVAMLEDRMIIILDLLAGLKDHEAVAVEEISEEMSDDEEEEEVEEVSEQDIKSKARERVSKDEKEEKDEKDEEDAGDEKGGSEDSGEEEFECDVCGDVFDSKRGLASHKAQKH